jgi:hypothetical protein
VDVKQGGESKQKTGWLRNQADKPPVRVRIYLPSAHIKNILQFHDKSAPKDKRRQGTGDPDDGMPPCSRKRAHTSYHQRVTAGKERGP